MPSASQLHILFLAILLFAAGMALSLARLWRDSLLLRRGSKWCAVFGALSSLGVLIWHSATRTTGTWMPLEDNFEAFLWLAILLAGFAFYVQFTKPLGGLDWFIFPLVIILLVAASVFGKAKPQEYLDTTWSWVHRISAYGGTLAFAVAGAVGALYLLAAGDFALRSLQPAPNLQALSALERITFSAVTLGFALLTIGLITGVIRVLKPEPSRLGTHWFTSPKVILAFAMWVVYAIVLHSRINPSFRGRKVAILSIVGCILMVGTLVALNLIPAGGNH